MGLACDCDYGVDFASTAWHTARKAHECTGCGRDIKPGDEYERTFSIQDGYAYTYKLCDTCGSISGALSEAGFCWDPEDMPGNYFEYLDEFVRHSYDEDGDKYVLPNGRTVREQVDAVYPPRSTR